jgi:hypothetical protein
METRSFCWHGCLHTLTRRRQEATMTAVDRLGFHVLLKRTGGWLSGNQPFRSIAKRMSISSDSWFQGAGR